MHDIAFNLADIIQIGGIIAIGTGTIAAIKATGSSNARDIARLETKQDKYNNLQERVMSTEQSTRSAHHRLDEQREDIEKLAIKQEESSRQILSRMDDHQRMLAKHMEMHILDRSHPRRSESD